MKLPPGCWGHCQSWSAMGAWAKKPLLRKDRPGPRAEPPSCGASPASSADKTLVAPIRESVWGSHPAFTEQAKRVKLELKNDKLVSDTLHNQLQGSGHYKRVSFDLRGTRLLVGARLAELQVQVSRWRLTLWVPSLCVSDTSRCSCPSTWISILRSPQEADATNCLLPGYLQERTRIVQSLTRGRDS